MNSYIPIVFCFDANFANFAAVATFSAFTNSVVPLKIYWLVPSRDLEVVNLKRESLSLFGINILIKPVDDKHFLDWKEVAHLKKATYLRLLIPETVEEEDKIIYLDSDVIIQDDLSRLYSIDLGAHAIAGALELVVEGRPTKMPLSKPISYINCGVLVMDLKCLRQSGFFKKCAEIYEKYTKQITWADQCIINKYVESGKKILDPFWNHYVTPGKKAGDCKKKEVQAEPPSILHFITQKKPWHMSYPPHIADKWWHYADKLQLDGLRREDYQAEIRRSILTRIKDSVMKRLSKLARLIGKI